jgi:hypothetical protein
LHGHYRIESYIPKSHLSIEGVQGFEPVDVTWSLTYTADNSSFASGFKRDASHEKVAVEAGGMTHFGSNRGKSR